ncbi:OmpA family protein [Pannonibacter phragmitetus]|uniref:OmpA family protein n=1 Tax=Pannonibacter phragmitetus TaxID=121719 RepID=UPI000F03E183|nr:OmpA family protein [Pannonibacter phragmitetus]
MVTPTQSANVLESKGYNRGLILGLTMAESMLLLVFCLLLVAGAIIKAERDKTREAMSAQKNTEVQLAKVNEQVKDMAEKEKELTKYLDDFRQKILLAGTPDASREALEKEWRELVADRKELHVFQSRGLTPEQITKAKEILEYLRQLGLDTQDISALEVRVKALMEAEKQQAQSKPHEWPPIINLSEAGGYFFKSGSAELTEAFTTRLKGSITSQIALNLEQYDVDIIEVIGHTDEQPISRTGSNLDKEIIDVVEGKKPITSIIPADNAGLGMARALAVVNVLKTDERLRGATILPMSGAQLVLPGDQLTAGQAGDVEARRRIEIRVRRRNGN